MQSTYDLRGQLESRTRFARVDGAGQGVADGTESITRYVHGPRGELLHEIDPRAGTPRTLWSQDFAKDTAGLTKLPSGYMLLNLGSLTTYARSISGKDTYFGVSGTREQALGTVFRGEVTTTAASPHRYVLFGADNANTNGVLRRHMVYFGGDAIYAHYRDSALRNVYLGQAKDHTTYVVEVATDALGSTLFVYEKGAARSSGFIDRRDVADWGVARTAIEVMASPRTGTTSRTDLDNLSERTGLDAELLPPTEN